MLQFMGLERVGRDLATEQQQPSLNTLVVDCSTPGLPAPHHLLAFSQVDVYCIGDAVQPSHPLTSSTLSAFNVSQHQGLFQCCLFSSDDQNTGASASASVLPVNIQD